MVLNIDMNIANRPFKHDFKGVTIFFDDSGSGKSLLFKSIVRFCHLNNIDCIKYDYTNYLKDLSHITNVDVVILDNYDLYGSKEMSEKLFVMKKIIIMSVKDIFLVPEKYRYNNSFCLITKEGLKVG